LAIHDFYQAALYWLRNVSLMNFIQKRREKHGSGCAEILLKNNFLTYMGATTV